MRAFILAPPTSEARVGINKAVVREACYLVALLVGTLAVLTFLWFAAGSPWRESWKVYGTYVVCGFIVLGVRAFRRTRGSVVRR
jgi:hypothetical protein